MKLKDRLRSRRRVSTDEDAQRHLQQIYEDRLALAAAKQLLKHALASMEQDPQSLPALTVRERIRVFLERHP